MTDPAPCTRCGADAYGCETHPCCEFWAEQIAATGTCPACKESRAARRSRRPIRQEGIAR